MKYLKYLIYTIGTISAITVVIGWIPALAIILTGTETGRLIDGGWFLGFYFCCLLLSEFFFKNYKG